MAIVARIGGVSRACNPHVLVAMQNAEELSCFPAVLAAIDAVAKEHLCFGIDHRRGRNEADTVSWSLEPLRLAERAGAPRSTPDVRQPWNLSPADTPRPTMVFRRNNLRASSS